MTQPTCKDRINKEFENIMEDFEVLLKLINDIDPDDLTDDDKKILSDLGQDPDDIASIDPWQVLNEYGLSLELDADTRGASMAEDFKRLVNEEDYTEKEAAEVSGQAAVKWCLSYGGPADYLIFEYTRDRRGWWEVTDIVYSFQDWFDGALLHPSADDYETLESIIGALLEIDWLL